mmetsp:Transcript_41551/g.88543  ORF Transcript_41551/g.88543 Transcript_41551/m.88543 type:complete len:255 (+) Transcript_41551:991-1755(+)
MVDPLMMTRVPELGCERVDIDPIDVGQGSTTEEVATVLSDGNGGHAAEDLALVLDLQRQAVDAGHRAIASATKEITIGQEGRDRDAEGEALSRGRLLEQCRVQSHLEDVPGRGAAITETIVGIDEHIRGDALHLAQLDLCGSQLLVCQVEMPNDDVVVASSHHVELAVVEEAHAMCRVCGRGCTADGSTVLNLPDHQAVVILAAKRCKVGRILGEAKRGHCNLVQAQAVDLPPLSEGPNDHVRREAHEGLLPRR